MKIVKYGNDCVILDRVLGTQVVEGDEEQLVKQNEWLPNQYKTITFNRIKFYFESRNLHLSMPSKEEAVKAHNKIIDFLQNDEKLLDLTNRETQCS